MKNITQGPNFTKQSRYSSSRCHLYLHGFSLSHSAPKNYEGHRSQQQVAEWTILFKIHVIIDAEDSEATLLLEARVLFFFFPEYVTPRFKKSHVLSRRARAITCAPLLPVQLSQCRNKYLKIRFNSNIKSQVWPDVRSYTSNKKKRILHMCTKH